MFRHLDVGVTKRERRPFNLLCILRQCWRVQRGMILNAWKEMVLTLIGRTISFNMKLKLRNWANHKCLQPLLPFLKSYSWEKTHCHIVSKPGISNSFYIVGYIQPTLILSWLNQCNCPFCQKEICQHNSLSLNCKE